MADNHHHHQFSVSLITVMDHLWLHQTILFKEPTSQFLSKNPHHLQYHASLYLEEVPVNEQDNEKEPSKEDEEKTEVKNLKERRTRLERSQSSSPPSSTQERLRNKRTAASAELEKSMSCRSLTELELEEVKGFMDLGFRFSNQHLINPRMISVLPGLRRVNFLHNQVANYKDDVDEGGAMRPCFSEVWLTKRPNSPLLNLKMPRAIASSAAAVDDMKEHLRFWAKTVASAVQQEREIVC